MAIFGIYVRFLGCTHLKTNGWNLKNHPLKKEKHLKQTSIFWLQNVTFPGCKCCGFLIASFKVSNVENPVDIPLYWLVNRDPYNGLL